MSTEPQVGSDKCTQLVRIAPYEYVHILNLNTHITRLVLGPKSYVCLKDEKLVFGPKLMITLPVFNYCVIRNPVVRDEQNKPIMDSFGQVKLNLGDEEYRFHQDPFPLYPGEQLVDEVKHLPVVKANTALHLQALVEFVDVKGEKRSAGEEWLFDGPGTYYPRKEVEILQEEEAEVIEVNTALCLTAMRDCTDRNGETRTIGERWLLRTPGAYLPGAYEDVLGKRKAHVLTELNALHLRSLEAHVDEFGHKRKYGEEWLITRKEAASYICNVHQEIVCEVPATILNAHQYCVIMNPVDSTGVPQMGRRKLIRGEATFFLNPGEELENSVLNTYLLQSDEGLVLRALEGFKDRVRTDTGSFQTVYRQPGVQWLIRGPMEYVPPVEVEIVVRRHAIPLDKNEGKYIRNKRTGQIRAVIGQTYMLTEEEELWEKKVPNEISRMLQLNKDPLSDRGYQSLEEKLTYDHSSSRLDFTDVVKLRVPHNAAVQIYDYRAKVARVQFGPALVMLGPQEQFTKLSLSGGKPKQPNKIQALCLLLGPDFSTDIVVVETADHARLSLRLSYNWYFNVPKPCSQEEAAKLFAIPDFVGDICKAMASRIRGVVASVPFDDFHKNSARIVRASVFGLDEHDKVRNHFVFSQNNLHITSVDIQRVEPLDSRAKESLEKSVQLAIEIRTKSQEATAKHEADRLEQESLGALLRQKILDEATVEEARKTLVEMRVQLSTLESCGNARSEAQSLAEAARITGEAAIQSAKLMAEANQINMMGEIECKQKQYESEIKLLNSKNELENKYEAEQAEIEINRFVSMVEAVGPDALAAIVSAGGEQAEQLLGCIGLQSSLVTNGAQPINLLATAHGLIGQLSKPTSYGLETTQSS